MSTKVEKHILCVDDDLSILKMFSRYLQLKNYRVSAFENGREAGKAFFTDPPDLVLLDLKLVDMDGFDLLELFAVKSPEIPVVVVSGTGEMSTVLRSLRSGAWDFIMKPLESLEILGHVVSKVLDKSALLWENRLYRENLEEKVRQRTKELEDLNLLLRREIEERCRIEVEREALMQELTHKKEELESFIYAVSHDLRSPLVNIHGFSNEISYSCEELRKAMNSSDDDNQKKAFFIVNEELPFSLKYILSSTQKMDQLIKGLIKIARLGLEPNSFKQIDMNVLLSDIIKCKQFQIREYQAEIIVDRLYPCFGSLPHINQVFSNLIDNSLKYSVIERKPVIRVMNSHEGDIVVYHLSDNGQGIRVDDCDKIFDLFYRVANNGGDKSGEGIGLSVVKKILRRHGGGVKAVPNHDYGTSFFVTIPIQANRVCGSQGKK